MDRYHYMGVCANKIFNTLSQVILDDRILIQHQNSKSDSLTVSKISGASGLFRSLLSGLRRAMQGFMYAFFFFLFYHLVASATSSIILKTS